MSEKGNLKKENNEKSPYIDPKVPTKLVTPRNIIIFVILIIFWLIGFIIPFIATPKSFTKFKSENQVIPENQTPTFDEPLNINQLYEQLDQIAKFYSNKLEIIETNYTGYKESDVKIKVAKINMKSLSKEPKRVVLVVSDLAGNILDAPLACLKLILVLCGDCRHKHLLLSDYEWHIMPVMNPEGLNRTLNYRDSNIKVARKTSNLNGAGASDDLCLGVNLDGNFDFHFGEDEDKNNPNEPSPKYRDKCNPEFTGSEPNSENEIRALINFIDETFTKKNRDVDVFFQIGGNEFVNEITYPWEFTTAPVFHFDLLESTAKNAAKKVSNATGIKTKYMQAAYKGVRSGTLLDYMMGHYLVPFAYSIEPMFEITESAAQADPKIYIRKVIESISGIMAQLKVIQDEQEEKGYRSSPVKVE